VDALAKKGKKEALNQEATDHGLLYQ